MYMELDLVSMYIYICWTAWGNTVRAVSVVTRFRIMCINKILCHLTLCLALCVLQIANGQDEPSILPEGACEIDDDIKSGLECTSDIEEVAGVSYVTEQTYCSYKPEELCLTCISGELVKMSCDETPKRRRKRGFFRRAFRGAFGGAFGGVLRVFRRRRPPPRPVNTPPTITCPSIRKGSPAPETLTYEILTWGKPTVRDKENNIVSTKQISGRPSGSKFGHGTHTVSYKVTDAGGLSNTCTVSFVVHVIRCPIPKSPSHGRVQCPETYAGSNVVFGKTCTFKCNSGYQLSGPATLKCTMNGRFPTLPTCKKISCGTPPVPKNARSVSCTEGHVLGSVCSPHCVQGYRPAPAARVVCQANKKWTPYSWRCEDLQSPVFTKCPTKKINTLDRKYAWVVTAKDNSGTVNLKQVQGHRPGTPMEFGVHFIKYVASDAAGNTATCAFAIELKATDCPKPASNDTDIDFLCNGLTANSVCQLSCKSGARVEGSTYIACVQDKSRNNTSYWEPIHGEMATCNRRSCPPLNTPKNGALACDKQLGGTFCQIQCNEDFDVPYSDMRFHTFVCDNGADAWLPRNTAPDCLELSFPDEYYLPTDFYYFAGDCSNTQALNAIKQQFINNLNSIGLSPCMKDVCSVDDIDVSCGDMVEPTDFRRKRSTTSTNRVVHVKVRFRVKNSNRTLSPAAADALLKSLVAKSKNLMSTNTGMRTMLMKSMTPMIRRTDIATYARGSSNKFRGARLPTVLRPVVPPKVKSKSVTGKLAMKCQTGHAQMESGSCVPCSVGSYSDVKTHTCKPCPLNTYQDKAARTSCLACPAHHVTSSTGTAARDQCKKQCGLDTFSPTGLLPCFPCPEGKYQPKYGAKTCQPCPKSGAIPRKCLQDSRKTSISSDLMISDFLLTCDSEICLSFA